MRRCASDSVDGRASARGRLESTPTATGEDILASVFSSKRSATSACSSSRVGASRTASRSAIDLGHAVSWGASSKNVGQAVEPAAIQDASWRNHGLDGLDHSRCPVLVVTLVSGSRSPPCDHTLGKSRYHAHLRDYLTCLHHRQVTVFSRPSSRCTSHKKTSSALWPPRRRRSRRWHREKKYSTLISEKSQARKVLVVAQASQ